MGGVLNAQYIPLLFYNYSRLYSVSLSDIEAAKESGGVYELWELDMSGQPDRRSIAEYTVLYETIKSAHLGPAIYYPY